MTFDDDFALWLSTNGGTSWTTPAGTLPNNGCSLSRLAIDPANPSIFHVAPVAADAAMSPLWKTTDGGATFTTIDGSGYPTGMPLVNVEDIHLSRPHAAARRQLRPRLLAAELIDPVSPGRCGAG